MTCQTSDTWRWTLLLPDRSVRRCELMDVFRTGIQSAKHVEGSWKLQWWLSDPKFEIAKEPGVIIWIAKQANLSRQESKESVWHIYVCKSAEAHSGQPGKGSWFLWNLYRRQTQEDSISTQSIEASSDLVHSDICSKMNGQGKILPSLMIAHGYMSWRTRVKCSSMEKSSRKWEVIKSAPYRQWWTSLKFSHIWGSTPWMH